MTIRRHRRRLPLGVPTRVRGLRSRLVLAFVLVGLVSGAAATAASYREARNAVLESTQTPAMNRTREDVNRFLATVPYPPSQQALADLVGDLKDRLANQERDRVQVEYGDLVASSHDRLAVPADLRRQVRQRNALMYQRLIVGGTPQLVYGMPVMTQEQVPRPSGLEVYALVDLTQPKVRVEALAWSVARNTALSLALAVLLALVAAQGVLRPVRSLRQAARRLAAGELDTRLRVRGSDELADLVLTFNNTAADLEYNVGRLRTMESNARRFVADVSHELRTPLAAMTAVTDTLDEEADTLPPDAAIAARLVSTETRRLAQLVENLMEITRFDAGRAELRLDGEVDLAAAVQATLAARGWTGQVETDLPTEVTAEVDRRRVDVIVANLVGNALRHGRPPVRVGAGADPDGAQVWITVTDHGPGLPPEVVPHVFDRFYKADAARGRSEGSGLGLAIALENARLHGGTIEAENSPQGGATFRVRLPRRPVDREQPA